MTSVKSVMRQVKNLTLQYSEIEVKVREATSSDPWGTSTTLMADIAKATYNYNEYPKLFQMLWKRVNDETNVTHVLKGLILTEYLLRNGAEKFINDARYRSKDIQRLKDYKYYNADNVDVASDARAHAKLVYELLSDERRLTDERKRADHIKDVKHSGYSAGTYPTGYAGGQAPPKDYRRKVSVSDERPAPKANPPVDEDDPFEEKAEKKKKKKHKEDKDKDKGSDSEEDKKEDKKEKEHKKKDKKSKKKGDGATGGGGDDPFESDPFGSDPFAAGAAPAAVGARSGTSGEAGPVRSAQPLDLFAPSSSRPVSNVDFFSDSTPQSLGGGSGWVDAFEVKPVQQPSNPVHHQQQQQAQNDNLLTGDLWGTGGLVNVNDLTAPQQQTKKTMMSEGSASMASLRASAPLGQPVPNMSMGMGPQPMGMGMGMGPQPMGVNMGGPQPMGMGMGPQPTGMGMGPQPMGMGMGSQLGGMGIGAGRGSMGGGPVGMMGSPYPGGYPQPGGPMGSNMGGMGWGQPSQQPFFPTVTAAPASTNQNQAKAQAPGKQAAYQQPNLGEFSW